MSTGLKASLSVLKVFAQQACFIAETVLMALPRKNTWGILAAVSLLPGSPFSATSGPFTVLI